VIEYGLIYDVNIRRKSADSTLGIDMNLPQK
jgi:hypothetical protein